MTTEHLLDTWDKGSFTSASITHDTFRKGTGPVVIVVHEVPGITPAVLRFAEELVVSGFTVMMPNLFGTPGREVSGKYIASSMVKVCISKEFTTLALRQTSPIISWLRALAKSLYAEVGGRGVGAIGMCFSGGFALGMMVDDIMVAPVLSQPSLPFIIGNNRKKDLNLSPDDATIIAQRAADGCQVLGLRFTGDKLVGDRFTSLRELLADNFVAIELPSKSPRDHSVLTEQRDDASVARVIDFFREKLL